MTRENLIKLVRMVNEEMDTAMRSCQNEFELISDTIADINHRLERLYDALETGSLQLSDLAPRIQRLRQRQEQLHTARWELENLLSDRKVELVDLETVEDYVEDLRNLLEESPLAERKSFIKSFIREVRITGTEVLLTYNIPLSAGSSSQETLVVPPIVHYGGRYWT